MPNGAQKATIDPARKRGFLAHVHSFRALAIVAVVVTHVSGELNWAHADGTLRQCSASLFQNGTAMFVCAAGFLFQHLIDRFRYGDYLQNKLKYVVVPYVVVSLPMLAFPCVEQSGIFAPQASGPPLWIRVVRSFATAEHMPVPLWFIPMIVVFYLLAPLFAWIDRHPRAYWSFPIMLVVAGFAHRPLPVTAPLHAFIYFLASYLCGMWMSHYQEPLFSALRLRWVRWSLFGAFMALFLIETAVLHRGGAVFSATIFGAPQSGGGAGSFDLNQAGRLVLSALVLALLADAPARVHARADFLATASFGVFFLHEYVLKLLVKALGGAPAAGLWSLSSLTLVVLALTAVLVVLVRRLTGRWSRILIGC